MSHSDEWPDLLGLQNEGTRRSRGLTATRVAHASTNGRRMRLHIVCERWVGLFSLIQQVIAHIPWASAERRVPIVHFGAGCPYWRRDGYAGRDTVWEYYFEPLIPQHGTDTIPASFKREITERPLEFHEPWRALDSESIASSHFGDHPDIRKQTLKITYGRLDPSGRSRRRAARVIREFIRPRGYIQAQADETFRRELEGRFVIGVHARGIDALHDASGLRKDSLFLSSYSGVGCAVCALI
jgi:hypothetical protein